MRAKSDRDETQTGGLLCGRLLIGGVHVVEEQSGETVGDDGLLFLLAQLLVGWRVRSDQFSSIFFLW